MRRKEVEALLRTADLLCAAEAGDLLLRAGAVRHRHRPDVGPRLRREDLPPVTDADDLQATTRDAEIVHDLITRGRLAWLPANGRIRVPDTTSEEPS